MAVPSKAGNLAVSVVVLEVVDIRRRCRLDLVGQVLVLPLDPVVMVVVSEVALVAGEASEVVVEDSVVTGLAPVVVLATKVAVTGLVVPLPTHPLALVVDEAVEVASMAEVVAGMIVVALAVTVSP